jgi:hypothetical protein
MNIINQISLKDQTGLVMDEAFDVHPDRTDGPVCVK